jgi:hypothetical protein
VSMSHKRHFRESVQVQAPVRQYKAIPKFSDELAAKFWKLVDRRSENECWLWKGSTTSGTKGGVYGQWRGFRPHRIAYTLLVGPIPPEHTLDHLRESGICSSTLCCNPAHLEAVTLSVNVKRYRSSLSRICKRGHQMEPTGNCKACIKIKTAEWLEKRGKNNDYRREWYAANRERIQEQRRARRNRPERAA